MWASEQNRFFYTAPRPIIETFLLASIGVIISLNADNYNSLEKLIMIAASSRFAKNFTYTKSVVCNIWVTLMLHHIQNLFQILKKQINFHIEKI